MKFSKQTKKKRKHTQKHAHILKTHQNITETLKIMEKHEKQKNINIQGKNIRKTDKSKKNIQNS